LLRLKDTPVYRTPVKARRGARFKPCQRKPKLFQSAGKAYRRRLAEAAFRLFFLPDVRKACQKRAGRDHNGGGLIPRTVRSGDDKMPFGFLRQILDGHRAHRQIRVIKQRFLHVFAIELAVRLAARAAHRRAFAGVENTELDPRCVRYAPHNAIQSVDFAHHLALSEAPNGGIAGHFANRFNAMRRQQRARANTRRRRRRFAAGMTAADNDDIERFHGRKDIEKRRPESKRRDVERCLVGELCVPVRRGLGACSDAFLALCAPVRRNFPALAVHRACLFRKAKRKPSRVFSNIMGLIPINLIPIPWRYTEGWINRFHGKRRSRTHERF